MAQDERAEGWDRGACRADRAQRLFEILQQDLVRTCAAGCTRLAHVDALRVDARFVQVGNDLGRTSGNVRPSAQNSSARG